MAFEVGKIFWMLMNPGVLLALCITIGTALLWTKRIWLARVILTACTILVLSLTLLNLHGHLRRALENRFPPLLEVPDHVDGILILGGTIDVVTSHYRGQTNMNESSERLTAVIPLARRHPEAKILFSGGSNKLNGPGQPEADWAEIFFKDQGLPSHRMTFERSSRNTYENAINSLALVPNAKEETWLLVTSAAHMPRAMGVFQKLEWPVTPCPVDYRTRPSISFGVASLQKSLPEFSNALKEWIGLIYYRLMGYSDEFLPGSKTNI